jgi:hypothetical protein
VVVRFASKRIGWLSCAFAGCSVGENRDGSLCNF